MCEAHRPLDVHQQVVALIDGGRGFAVAVILRADGSTPQKVGAKAVIKADGKILGTLGGGLVEAETQRRAVEACRSQQPAVFDFHLTDTYAADAGPICGGSMRILIDPTAAGDRAAYARAAEAVRHRRRGVLLTTVRTGASPEVTAEWVPHDATPADLPFPGSDAVRSCLDRETPRLFTHSPPEPGQAVEVLVEPVIPPPLLLILGGGHVGQALARQAVLIGFQVTVVDDRPEFARPALFPENVTTRCGEIPRLVAEFPIADDTFVAIVTRGHRHDAEALAACIHSPAAYLGMIGSRRKVELMRKHFIQSGLATQEQLDRVFAPIGLDIGAVTVPEIATSITAELVAVRRRGRPASAPPHMASR